MSFVAMYNELLGSVPGLNVALAKTYINEALGMIYDEQLWSFQLQDSGWLTPGLFGGLQSYGPSAGVSPGTIATVPYSNEIVGDAVASAAWLAMRGRPFITEYQIRVPEYGLYSIVAMDATLPTAVMLTLDRPWMEPAQLLAPYMMYQAYFPVQMGFKKFHAIRDTTNNSKLNYWSATQMDLAEIDPQRTQYDLPRFAVPYQPDARAGSSTPGQMLYELWPHPLITLPYSYSSLVRGSQLAAPSDRVPYPLTDEMVKWRAKEVAYLWKEAQKGEDLARGSGADWKFLSQEAHAQYGLRSKSAKMLDQNLVDLYWTRFRRGDAGASQPYASLTGQLNIGTF